MVSGVFISVCICTFRRPQLLAGLLDALARQDWPQLASSVELVVVDNDPAHSAREVLQHKAATLAVPLRFAHADTPNISVARNTTVALARGEFIAFIDDDEMPRDDWLSQLVAAQRRFHADGVFAPVVPEYRADTPAWIRQGGYFDRARHATGTPIDDRDARTGNVLLRAARLKALEGPFDLGFGRTGGEDSLLFRDLLARQCVFVWCDEAPVFEEVPADRASAGWLVRRSFRIGQTWIRTELHRLPPPAQRTRGAWLCLRALVQLGVSLVLAAAWGLFSRVRAFHWVRIAAAQAGKITGMTRFQYREYGG